MKDEEVEKRGCRGLTYSRAIQSDELSTILNVRKLQRVAGVLYYVRIRSRIAKYRGRSKPSSSQLTSGAAEVVLPPISMRKTNYKPITCHETIAKQLIY